MSKLALDNMPRKTAALLVARRRELAAIAADKRFTAEHKRTLRDEVVQKYADRFQALQTERSTALEAARRRIDKPAPQDTAAMMASDRVWARAKARLDGGTHILELIAEAQQANDTDTLRVLAEEAAPYVLSHGGNKTLAQGVTELAKLHLGAAAPNAEQHATDDKALERSDYIAGIALGHAEAEPTGNHTVESLPLVDGSVLTVSGAE